MKNTSIDLLKLLPAWMRSDKANIALADGIKPVADTIAVDLKRLTRWNTIDQMSEEQLDYMAWELNVLWYEPTATIEVKRELIKKSDLVYMRLGTKWAVRQVVEDILGNATIEEWWEYGGKPYHFRIVCKDLAILGERYDKLMPIINVVKRKSAWLDAIAIELTGDLTAWFGIGYHEMSRERYMRRVS